MPAPSSATQVENDRPFVSSAMILRSLPDGALIADMDGMVRQANPAAAVLLGVSADALVGLRLTDLPGGEALAAAGATRSGLIALGERTLSYSSAPLNEENSQDSVVGALILLRDQTAELSRKRAQYDFVSRALHDVRVPLQAIGGTTEGLLRGWFGPITDEQREFLGMIKENAARQGDLLSNIFDVYVLKANLIQLSQEPVHIEGLVHEVAHEFAARYQARAIGMALEMAEHLPAVSGDRRRLRQVLVALFENACKYSLADGKVTVCVQARDGLVHFDVCDQGVGIREVDQPKIFTPFFRGESPLKEGRYGGLNLAIARMLIALHGGQLWFESVEGQGSTFSFTLPIVE
ncbi:MAG TPA: HAMP domain-containing sensor histidine kinase [Roseiflexaceae bacterium]|nr:HAMP domain-containing sensor histidine kinase [Roseiflexaceae bacterium]